MRNRAAEIPTKLELRGGRIEVLAEHARLIIVDIFNWLCCHDETGQGIAALLSDANLCGVESHGVMRVM